MNRSFSFEKIIIILFVGLHILYARSAAGQTNIVPDVDSLGDIWVVTIDNTFSMKSRHGISRDMELVGAGVRRRLERSAALSQVNWKSDRFLILKSGIRERARVKYVDTEFIRHTDGKLHHYKDQKSFARDIGSMITSGDYHNYVSFVSQMRLLSLHKALEFIAADSASKSYRDIKIMTISDDAVDQHDQWSTDYRTLKECAPDKVLYLSDLARKYIYNPLNGWGGGDMELEWSDETSLPHIWIYQYVTAEGCRERDTNGVYIRVRANDGHHVNFQVKQCESMPCLCKIDSVRVNDYTVKVGQYMTDKLSVGARYRNRAFCNDVVVYGKVQMEYTDSILGEHYKVVDFVQHGMVMPKHVSFTLNALVLMLFLATLLGLLYVLLLLPRKVVFDVYDASGRRHRVRRGYKWQWRGNIIPLLTLHIDSHHQVNALARQDGNIEHEQVVTKNITDEANGVLIVGRYEIRLSVDSVEHDSGKNDIESYYDAQADYPSLLKSCYRRSAEFRYHKMQHSKNAIVRCMGLFLLEFKVRLLGSNRYKYYQQGDTAVSIESSALAGKLFMIEKDKSPRCYSEKNYKDKLGEIGEYNIRLQMWRYYTSTTKTSIVNNSDVLVILSQSGGFRIWDVLITNQAKNGLVSLRNVSWVYHYALPCVSDTKSIQWERKMLMRYVRRTYNRRVVFVDYLNTDSDGNMAMLCFNLTHSFSMRFLSLVSTDVEPVCTPMYDPFSDGQNSSRQFMVRTNNDSRRSTNHLYESFLPQKLLKSKDVLDYSKRLSDTLIPFVGDQAVILEILDQSHYRVHGMDITIKNN